MGWFMGAVRCLVFVVGVVLSAGALAGEVSVAERLARVDGAVAVSANDYRVKVFEITIELIHLRTGEDRERIADMTLFASLKLKERGFDVSALEFILEAGVFYARVDQRVGYAQAVTLLMAQW